MKNIYKTLFGAAALVALSAPSQAQTVLWGDNTGSTTGTSGGYQNPEYNNSGYGNSGYGSTTHSGAYGSTTPTYNYGSACPPDRAPGLAKELERLVTSAEAYRAADPRVIADLRRLAAHYSGQVTGGVYNPPAQIISYISDDFADGEYLSSPTWRVLKGQWHVRSPHGLRPIIRNSTARPEAVSMEDLFSILAGQSPQRQPVEIHDAVIETTARIPNAFSFAVKVQDHQGKGGSQFVIHQGSSNRLGYRLELHLGQNARLALRRRGSRGYSELAVAPVSFAQGMPHEIKWTRDQSGRMEVMLDDVSAISVTDNTFRDDWQGFMLYNAKSDLSLSSIAITSG